jgi:hypothetical protein
MSYNAAEFLHGLFRRSSERPADGGGADAGSVADDALDIVPSDLPSEWFCLWDERAAIMEYDGGVPRERAEAEALKDIMDRMKREGAELTKHYLQ